LNSKHCHHNGYQLWEFGASFFTSTTKHHTIHSVFHACIRRNKMCNKQNPPVTQKNIPLKRFKIVSKSLLKNQKKLTKQKGFIFLFVLSELPVHINVINLQQLVLVNPYNTPSAAYQNIRPGYPTTLL
jgi:hypothetical protein